MKAILTALFLLPLGLSAWADSPSDGRSAPGHINSADEPMPHMDPLPPCEGMKLTGVALMQRGSFCQDSNGTAQNVKSGKPATAEEIAAWKQRDTNAIATYENSEKLKNQKILDLFQKAFPKEIGKKSIQMGTPLSSFGVYLTDLDIKKLHAAYEKSPLNQDPVIAESLKHPEALRQEFSKFCGDGEKTRTIACAYTAIGQLGYTYAKSVYNPTPAYPKSTEVGAQESTGDTAR